MQIKKKQIFIGSALTHLPKEVFGEYKALIYRIADLVEEKYSCVPKYALEHSDPQLAELRQTQRPDICYKLDRYLVESSELVIAETSFPSIGLGQELQIAEYANIPVIFLYKDYQNNIANEKNYQSKSNANHSIELGKHKITSVMALGNPAKVHEIKYSNLDDAIMKLDSYLCQILPKLKIRDKHNKYEETLSEIRKLSTMREYA